MIPHRMLSSEICAHGLKNRVTACRKRLRSHRATHRPLVSEEAVELLPVTASHLDSGLAFEGGDLTAGEALLSAGEPEVGIT